MLYKHHFSFSLSKYIISKLSGIFTMDFSSVNYSERDAKIVSSVQVFAKDPFKN